MKLEKPQAPILIFDIETVPDIPLLYTNYEESLKLDYNFDSKIHWNHFPFIETFQKQTEVTFPQTIYHMVLSICAVYIDPISYHIMDGFKVTIPKVDSYDEFKKMEYSLLEKFWDFTLKHKDFHKNWYQEFESNRNISSYEKNRMKKIPVTFCGYNIANFDLPVLEQRSLISFLKCPIEDYAKNLGTDSYRYKYAQDKVFDLMQFVSNYDNRSAKVNLDTLARAMGLGGKMKGMDGSLVANEYFCNHASARIEEYCAVDVLISYGVFLAIQKFRGVIEEKQFKECVIWFERWLLKEGKPESYKELVEQSKDFFGYAKK